MLRPTTASDAMDGGRGDEGGWGDMWAAAAIPRPPAVAVSAPPSCFFAFFDGTTSTDSGVQDTRERRSARRGATGSTAAALTAVTSVDPGVLASSLSGTTAAVTLASMVGQLSIVPAAPPSFLPPLSTSAEASGMYGVGAGVVIALPPCHLREGMRMLGPADGEAWPLRVGSTIAVALAFAPGAKGDTHGCKFVVESTSELLSSESVLVARLLLPCSSSLSFSSLLQLLSCSGGVVMDETADKTHFGVKQNAASS